MPGATGETTGVSTLIGCFAISAGVGPPLRVGVFMNGHSAPSYLRGVLAALRRLPYVELVLVIDVVDEAIQELGPDECLLLRIYRRRIDSRYDAEPDPLSPVDCSDVLVDVPTVTARRAGGGAGAELATDDVAAIRDCRLDVILDLGARAVRGAATSAAVCGVWRFHPGDSRRYSGQPPYLREIIASDPLSAVELDRLGPGPGTDLVLCRALFATSPLPSMRLNRLGPLWGAQHFVVQKLWELHQFGTGRLNERSEPTAFPAMRRPLPGAPGNVEFGHWLMDRATHGLWRRLRRKPSDVHWRVAVRRSRTPLYEEPGISALRTFRWLESPRGHFWADPFVVLHAGKRWLFFEDMDHSAGRAHIACGQLEQDGALGNVRAVLRRPYHLSYPQVFEVQGELFMIPESAGSGGVELYRARVFPDDWILEARLLEFKCVDSTVFKTGKRWWMFTSPMVIDGHAPITWLFGADQLTGPWRYHPAGPVSTDVQTARGAGNVIERNGRLIRPSQDCSGEYGRALVFSEIECLGEPRYRERMIGRIEGGWLPALSGIHTYNRAGEWEAIDGRFAVSATSLGGLNRQEL